MCIKSLSFLSKLIVNHFQLNQNILMLKSVSRNLNPILLSLPCLHLSIQILSVLLWVCYRSVEHPSFSLVRMGAFSSDQTSSLNSNTPPFGEFSKSRRATFILPLNICFANVFDNCSMDVSVLFYIILVCIALASLIS